MKLGCAGERGGAAPDLRKPEVERRRGFLGRLEVTRARGRISEAAYERLGRGRLNRLEGVGARVGGWGARGRLVGRGPGAGGPRARFLSTCPKPGAGLPPGWSLSAEKSY